MDIDKEKYLKILKAKGSNNPDFKYQYEELAHEMTSKFGRQMYVIFWRYPENKIREAFRVCNEKGIYKVAYLVGIINNL